MVAMANFNMTMVETSVNFLQKDGYFHQKKAEA